MLQRPRNTARILFASGALFAAGLVPALAADPTGDWRVADGVANIRVAQCNGAMWGVVSWEKTPGGTDVNNPDVSKQSRPTLGMPVLLDMKKTPGEDKWEGEVYNAKDGKSYSSSISPSGPNQLEIRGCVLGFLCGGETWTRVAGPIPSSPSNHLAKGSKSGATRSATAPKPGTTTGALGTTGSQHNAPSRAAQSHTAPLSRTTTGQKMAANAQAPDAVGDICLLPGVTAGLSH